MRNDPASTITSATPCRRHVLRLAAGIVAGTLLSGCGGGSPAASDAVTVVPAGTVQTPGVAPPTTQDTHPLNLALNLAYLGAAFYGHAARGIGLPMSLTGGIGSPGMATGARAIGFADPGLAGYAAELADDKQAQVVALRTEIGALAAAQPVMDLSGLANGAFSIAAQRTGIVAPGTVFDPYADDGRFLIGAFLIENVVAAAHRTLLVDGSAAGSPLVAASLADAIYHGGLIRSLLDARADTDAGIDLVLTRASATPGGGADLVDADGRPIPFTRQAAQVLNILYLSGNGAGGFLPAGANGVIA